MDGQLRVDNTYVRNGVLWPCFDHLLITYIMYMLILYTGSRANVKIAKRSDERGGPKMDQKRVKKWPKMGHFGPFLGPCYVPRHWPLLYEKHRLLPRFENTKMGKKWVKNDIKWPNLSHIWYMWFYAREWL